MLACYEGMFFFFEEGYKLRTAQEKGGDHKAPLKGTSSGDNAVKDALNIVLDCLDDAKADNTTMINITDKSSLGDYMVVTSGRSNRHVSAICDQLLRTLKEAGLGSPRVEGLSQGDWVLIDNGDIIIHVFRPEIREFYNIEKMWQTPDIDDTMVH